MKIFKYTQELNNDQNISKLVHISSILFGPFIPYLFYSLNKNKMNILESESKEALNYNLTLLLFAPITLFDTFDIFQVPIVSLVFLSLNILHVLNYIYENNEGNTPRYLLKITFL